MIPLGDRRLERSPLHRGLPRKLARNPLQNLWESFPSHAGRLVLEWLRKDTPRSARRSLRDAVNRPTLYRTYVPNCYENTYKNVLPRCVLRLAQVAGRQAEAYFLGSPQSIDLGTC
jgi:hypothetical protein